MKLCACNTIHEDAFTYCRGCRQVSQQMKSFELNSEGKYISQDLIVKVNERGDVNVIRFEGNKINASINYFRGNYETAKGNDVL